MGRDAEGFAFQLAAMALRIALINVNFDDNEEEVLETIYSVEESTAEKYSEGDELDLHGENIMVLLHPGHYYQIQKEVPYKNYDKFLSCLYETYDLGVKFEFKQMSKIAALQSS
eukprot:TRINITY_DN18248_c0_g1_i2.p4 TRINITY_DN18248_c0_g1~~TRINITY_DN18248_c0_g1_i2.p4  ORF type:complete len:114 (+),score=23.36 TRINITY_DN18248_c0_g1_i2:246-587(+)